MNQEIVLSTEHTRPAAIDEADGEVIVRFDSLGAGDPARSLFYYFVNDKLVRARYITNASHDDPQDFISDFAALESKLQETSGKPVIDRAVWESDLYQQERLPYLEQDRAHASDILPSDKNTGLSVSLGYLKMYTERVSARSRIVHTLNGAEARVSHQIEYRSLESEER